MRYLQLLPLATFCVMVLLTVKMVSLVDYLISSTSLTSATPLRPGQAIAAPVPQTEPSQPDVKSVTQEKTKQDSTPDSTSPDQAAPLVEETVFDPNNLSEAEIKVLEKLNERRLALDQREKQLDQREALQKATKTDIDGRVAELTALKKTLDDTTKELKKLADTIEAEDQAKIDKLVSLYKNMKPLSAANIFNKLNLSILLQLVRSMKPSDSAQIIALMDPAIAEKLTTHLAEQRLLPELVSK